jgi:septum site-determining protein MinC
MTSDRSNQTPVNQASEPSSPPAVQPLPAVGDLSKLSETPTGLETTLATATKSTPPKPATTAPPIVAPPIVIPAQTTGIPFAPSQAVVAEPLPPALAAKAAAEAIAKAANPGAVTTPAPITPTPAPNAETPATPAADQPTPPSEAPTPTDDQTQGADTPPANDPTAPAKPLLEGNHAPQVRFKNEHGKLLLILPSETNDASGSGTLSYAWPEVMMQLRQRLQAESRNWEANTAVHLVARDRLLNAQQLQEIVEALGLAKMQLRRVYTSRRQTAITASTAGYSVEQHVAVTNLNPAPAEAGEAMAEPLVLKSTLRSGAEIRHNGTVVVIGDANPGSSIIAEGDILVWGRLRGTAHAGSKGNTRSRIMALQMEPAQIRIADFVARGPSTTPTQFFPELAYVTTKGTISIARVSDFKESIPTPTAGRKLPATGKQF